jgi:hypothetical protein
MFTTAKLSNGGAQSYLKMMSNPPDMCFGQTAASTGRSCYKMFYSDILTELRNTNPGWSICEPPCGVSPGM